MNIMRNISLPNPELLFDQLVDQVQADISNYTALVGIHTGGAWLAERLYQALSAKKSLEPLGLLSVSFYRDDFDRIGLHAQTKPSEIPFNVNGARILLVAITVLFIVEFEKTLFRKTLSRNHGHKSAGGGNNSKDSTTPTTVSRS